MFSLIMQPVVWHLHIYVYLYMRMSKKQMRREEKVYMNMYVRVCIPDVILRWYIFSSYTFRVEKKVCLVP